MIYAVTVTEDIARVTTGTVKAICMDDAYDRASDGEFKKENVEEDSDVMQQAETEVEFDADASRAHIKTLSAKQLEKELAEHEEALEENDGDEDIAQYIAMLKKAIKKEK